MNDAQGAKLSDSVRAAVSAAVCFVFFVCVCYFFAAEGGSGAGLVIRAPDDWYSGARVAVAALLASGLSALVYRRPASRPVVGAIALGLIFLSIEVLGIWQQAADLVYIIPRSTVEVAMKSAGFDALDWRQQRLNAIVLLVRIYWIYYMVYILWTIVVLYAAYLGQYAVGLLLIKRQARKESALYVAENAGLGLVASISAGIIAMILAAGLSGFATSSPRTPFSGGATPDQSKRQTSVASRKAPDARPTRKPEAVRVFTTANVTAEFDPLRTDVAELAPKAVSFGELRTRLFLVALTFFLMAYIAALSFRPRTSTWVACGAALGVTVLPMAAAKWPLRGGAFYSILEASPFVLAGVAVTSALVGDWLARVLLARVRARKSDTYRPL